MPHTSETSVDAKICLLGNCIMRNYTVLLEMRKFLVKNYKYLPKYCTQHHPPEVLCRSECTWLSSSWHQLDLFPPGV